MTYRQGYHPSYTGLQKNQKHRWVLGCSSDQRRLLRLLVRTYILKGSNTLPNSLTSDYWGLEQMNRWTTKTNDRLKYRRIINNNISSPNRSGSNEVDRRRRSKRREKIVTIPCRLPNIPYLLRSDGESEGRESRVMETHAKSRKGAWREKAPGDTMRLHPSCPMILWKGNPVLDVASRAVCDSGRVNDSGFLCSLIEDRPAQTIVWMATAEQITDVIVGYRQGDWLNRYTPDSSMWFEGADWTVS